MSTHRRRAPEHLDPVADDFKNQKKNDGVLVLGINVGEDEIEGSGAKAITNHIQHCSEVGTCPLHQPQRQTLVQVSSGYTVARVEDIADEIKEAEDTRRDPADRNATGDWNPQSKRKLCPSQREHIR